ncbi:MAG: hypothetical protein GC151_00700 [Betaproteobacteria bacterium]|nr:hypothetical protein [Betaproteobacteria bacterium]
MMMTRTPGRVPGFRRGLACTALGFAVLGCVPSAFAVTMEVVWSNERCDYVLAKNEDGYGVVQKATPIVLAPGDKLEGALDEVGFFRKVTKVGGDQPVMMRGMKYGILRKEAVNTIWEWSRYCNPPSAK